MRSLFVYLSTCSRQPGNPLASQIEKSHLSVVIRNCHYSAAGDGQSVYCRVWSDCSKWRPHVAKIPHPDTAVIWAWYNFVFSSEHCTCYCPAIKAFHKMKTTTSPPKLVPCKMKILHWRANDLSPKIFRYVRGTFTTFKKRHGQARSPPTMYLGKSTA